MNTLQSSKPSAWVSEPFGLTNSNASTRVFMRPIGLDMAEVGGSTNAGGEVYRGSSAGKAEKRAVRLT